MRDTLAERLLVRVMGWDRDKVKAELPLVLALASFKYDEYQQFSPGMRFVESLARWLRQFEDPGDRAAAYEFVKQRMIFCSSSEMCHFVEMAYPHHIRPHLLRRAAEEGGQNVRHVGRVAGSAVFKILQRQCLFLGLSDGARIDLFRRSNRELSTEQIWQTHELADERVHKLLEKLEEGVIALGGPGGQGTTFSTVVLLDDFSASGRSYYMPKDDGTLGGKIVKFYRRLVGTDGSLSKLVEVGRMHLIILLYVATDQALSHLEECSRTLWGPIGVPWHIEVVQRLPAQLKLTPVNCGPLAGAIDQCYDDVIHDSHMRKGGTDDSKYGFAACGLPLVLHHNTPNNSIALLWSYEDTRYRGLFPRIQRHKEAP